MYPCILVSLYPCILVSLYPCIRVPLYPCILESFYPCILVSNANVMQPTGYTDFLDILNQIFTYFFLIECTLKLGAFRFKVILFLLSFFVLIKYSSKKISENKKNPWNLKCSSHFFEVRFGPLKIVNFDIRLFCRFVRNVFFY